MKNSDIVRPFETSLFVQFGFTGESGNVSTVRLDQGVTFSLEDKVIQARYHDGAGNLFVVERFSSDSLAVSAFSRLQAAVTRYARLRRVGAVARSLIKWGVGPAILATLALAMNMAATRVVGADGTAAQVAASAPPLVPLPPSSPVPANSAAASPATAARPADLARAMVDGIKSGKYSVQLSKGSKGTLYVFSDPLCSHCQSFEPELERLAKEYTVHVFPVSVIGGEDSLRPLGKLLCAKPDARVGLWKKSVNGETLPGDSCADGAAAVEANNQFFRVMRFAGTPTVINQVGEQTPDTVLHTADAIKRWLASSAVAQK